MVLLAIVSGGAFLASFDGAAVAVALPSISRSLGLGYAQALWIPTLYLLVVAGLLLPAGRSADRSGRTTHYTIGLGLFCLGSIAAGAAPDQWWLYAGRCCQGVGGAFIVTTSAALAVAVSTPKRRGRALGFNTMCVYLGAATGPALGGLLVTVLGWRSIFLFSAVAAALLLAAVRVSGAARRVGLNDGDRSSGTANVAGSLTFAVGDSRAPTRADLRSGVGLGVLEGARHGCHRRQRRSSSSALRETRSSRPTGRPRALSREPVVRGRLRGSSSGLRGDLRRRPADRGRPAGSPGTRRRCHRDDPADAARHDGDPRASCGPLVRPHRVPGTHDERGEPSWRWARWCSRRWGPPVRGRAPLRGWPSSGSVSVSSARPNISAVLSSVSQRRLSAGLRRTGD